MRAALVFCVLAALTAVAYAQNVRNTPATYNADGSHLSSLDPCTDINVQTWQDVPASRYTLDPHFDEGVAADYGSIWNGRDQQFFFPNGFRKGQVFEDNNPPFCFRVSGTKNRQVQVMIQTVDEQARLCIKDVHTGTRAAGSIDKCFTDRTTACFGGMTNTDGLQLMVYADSAGATSSTPFWYRVRVSEGTWDLSGREGARADSARESLEMWCDMQDQDTMLMQFPRDLRSLVPPAVVVHPVPDSAMVHGASLLAMLLCAVVALFAARRV